MSYLDIYDVIARSEVNGKAYWTKHGVLLVKQEGKMSLKINSVPVGKDWDGWFTVAERTEKTGKQGGSAQDPAFSRNLSREDTQPEPF